MRRCVQTFDSYCMTKVMMWLMTSFNHIVHRVFQLSISLDIVYFVKTNEHLKVKS